MITVQQQRGFTLIIAVLVSGLLLTIGFAIFNITTKQLILASSSTNSQVAFAAADTALECALFWDQKQDAFALQNSLGSIICDGQTASISSSRSGNQYTRTFSLTLDSGARCAQVTVLKQTGGAGSTVINASGFNTCNDANPRKTERGLRVRYSGL